MNEQVESVPALNDAESFELSVFEPAERFATPVGLQMHFRHKPRHPIVLTRYQVLNCYMGRVGLIKRSV